MERPKRPLSSFNLFYRYKRATIHAMVGEDPSKEDVLKILSATVGMEEEIDQQPPISDDEANINALRRSRIREALKDKILPNAAAKKRTHRKASNSLGLSFSEMGKLMTVYWKRIDDYGKEVFEELTAEGRQLYHGLMDEYNKSSSNDNNDKTTTTSSSSTDNKNKKKKNKKKSDSKEPNSADNTKINSAPDNAKFMQYMNNYKGTIGIDVLAKESASAMAAHATYTFPVVAAIPALQYPWGQGVSMPAHMMAHQRAHPKPTTMAPRNVEKMAPKKVEEMTSNAAVQTTLPNVVQDMLSLIKPAASKSLPNPTVNEEKNEEKKESKPSSSNKTAVNSSSDSKHKLSEESKGSLPLKKRFKHE